MSYTFTKKNVSKMVGNKLVPCHAVVTSAPMTKWLCTLALSFTCVVGQAAPLSSQDDMDRLLADKNLLTRLDDVRHRVTDKASGIVFNAVGFMGVPYTRGGNTVDSGFDCSGFVRAMYQQTVGLLLPRRANEQAAATQTIDKAELQPGDLCSSTPCAAPSAMWASTWGTASSSTRPSPAPRCGWKT